MTLTNILHADRRSLQKVLLAVGSSWQSVASHHLFIVTSDDRKRLTEKTNISTDNLTNKKSFKPVRRTSLQLVDIVKEPVRSVRYSQVNN